MASYIKKANGWAYRATRGSGDDRVQYQEGGFKTKREAQQAAAKAEAAYDRGILPDAGKTSLADYFDEWIKTFKLGKHSASTDHWYLIVAGYIREYFKNTPLDKINRAAYQKFIDWLGTNPRGRRNQPLAHTTINRVNHYVRTTLKDAIDEGAISRDFTINVVVGRTSAKPASEKFLSKKELSALITLMKQNANMQRMSNYMLLTQAYTGMRFEEVAGLTWDCVDFDHKTININKSWNYKNKKMTHNFGRLKTESSYRIISAPDKLLDILRSLKTEQSTLFTAQFYIDPDNLCFRNYRHVIVDNKAVNSTLKADCVKVNSKNIITSHGLRHTHGSLLIYAGIDILSVSKRLGHADMQITSKTYIHEIEEMKLRDNDAISVALNKL